MAKRLQKKVLAHVKSLPLTHSSIDSCQLLRPGLSEPDAKAAAFLLQNESATIATTLGFANLDGKTRKAISTCRTSLKEKIDSRCGGVKLYEKRVNIAEARKELVNVVRGHEEPDDNSTFIHDNNKISSLVYAPALVGNNAHKVAVEAFASEKHRLGCKDQEYVDLLQKVTNTRRLMKDNWGKKEAFLQSFQPTVNQVSFSALLRNGVLDKDSNALLAYANCFFFEEQMMKANLQVVYYKSDDIFPQSANLAEYERYPETEARLRFEARREESEGKESRRKEMAARRYMEERDKTLHLMAKAWLNPDHEVSKIMLSQIKSKVDVDDEKRKKRNKKSSESRRKSYWKKKKAEIDDELEELVEEAFGIVKQQIVKFV